MRMGRIWWPRTCCAFACDAMPLKAPWGGQLRHAGMVLDSSSSLWHSAVSYSARSRATSFPMQIATLLIQSECKLHDCRNRFEASTLPFWDSDGACSRLLARKHAASNHCFPASGDVIQCALAILEIGDLFVDIAGLQDLGLVDATNIFVSKFLMSTDVDSQHLRYLRKSDALVHGVQIDGPIVQDPYADFPGETPGCLTKHLLPQILRIYNAWASMYISVNIVMSFDDLCAKLFPFRHLQETSPAKHLLSKASLINEVSNLPRPNS